MTYNKEHIDYYVYLEEVRQSGNRNMFGVAPDLAIAFGLSKYEARRICGEWMEGYVDMRNDGVFEEI